MHAATAVAASIVALLATTASAADWHFAGEKLIEDDAHVLFYDADSIERPAAGIARVSVKSIRDDELMNALKVDKKSIDDAVLAKLSKGYVPRLYQLESEKSKLPDANDLRDAQEFAVELEVIANRSGVLVSQRGVYEFDCAARRVKALSLQEFRVDGSPLRGAQGIGEWVTYAPNSLPDAQSQLVCP